jgi:DNA-binding IclR family transcriptional regulator
MQLNVGTPDRRQVRNPTESILSSYKEMPGLILHLNQAARLFGLREATCRTVLDELVRQGKLRRAADGQYLAV